MRNIANRIAIRDRSTIVYPDHLWVPFHESSGASVAYSGSLSGTAFSGSLTFGAAPTWTADSMAQPAAANTTGGAISTDATLQAATAMPGGGGIICLSCIKFASYINDATNEEMLFQWGANSASGGYGFGLYGGANLNVRAFIWDKAGTGAIAVNKSITTLIDQYLTLEAYIKPGYVAVSYGGNWSGASTASGGTSFQTDTVPSGFAASVLCGHTNTTTKANTLNEGANGNRQVGELVIIRDVDGSLESSMATIAAEHATYWREKLISLDTR